MNDIIKRFCLTLAVGLVTGLSAVSCSEGVGSSMIWDIAPIVVQVYVNNSDGESLIDPDSQSGPYDLTSITAQWRDSTYNVASDEPKTKAYFAAFDGLTLKSDAYGRWYLCFGELDGEENINNENLTINWGDGSSDTITIFNKFRWKTNGNPSITRRFYLNGEKQDNDIAVFKLVK